MQFGEVLFFYVNVMLDKNSQFINFIVDYKYEKCGKVMIYVLIGIVIYFFCYVIYQIKDIGDICILLKIYNLDCNEFFEGVIFLDDCDILIIYVQLKDESLVVSVLI